MLWSLMAGILYEIICSRYAYESVGNQFIYHRGEYYNDTLLLLKKYICAF